MSGVSFNPGAQLSPSWSQVCPVASNLFVRIRSLWASGEDLQLLCHRFYSFTIGWVENPSWPQEALGFQDGKFLEEQVVRGEGREAQVRPLLLPSEFPGAERPVFPTSTTAFWAGSFPPNGGGRKQGSNFRVSGAVSFFTH